MRSMMNRSISFGLVNVPVKVYAASESHDVKFHQHHGGNCLGSVGKQDYCKECGEVVAYADIVKGVDVDGTLVTLTKDDITQVEEDAGKAIEVVQFAPAEQVNPLTLESPYYLEPVKESVEGYALLREVLTESDRVGIVRYTNRGRQHLAVLRAVEGVLTMQNLLWADELRAPEFAILQKRVTLAPAAVKMAEVLVESMMADFSPQDHVDTYTDRLGAVIRAKADGSELADVDGGNGTEDVSDLLAALEASVKRQPKGQVA